ncbi:hypothetical protein EJ08DRAFT_735299 [Tothia fuscella]|uniref:Uncharacterized protein n=1 Tax=Tothia fuscella TaxID=1048955 RepID=A0A9P4TX74_9PEZI|nr:hypothetical protein EJ08DRAFT_735299 [Tothia fuscella]
MAVKTRSSLMEAAKKIESSSATSKSTEKKRKGNTSPPEPNGKQARGSNANKPTKKSKRNPKRPLKLHIPKTDSPFPTQNNTLDPSDESFPLYNFPREIRDIIYRHWLTISDKTPDNITAQNDDGAGGAYTQLCGWNTPFSTCRQIRREAQQVYFETRIVQVRTLDIAEDFLAFIGKDGCDRLHGISLGCDAGLAAPGDVHTSRVNVFNTKLPKLQSLNIDPTSVWKLG